MVSKASAPRSKMSGLQLTLLTALNMLGSGIIMIPAKIAAVGTVSVLAWVATGILAVCMAYVFANCGIFSSHRGGLGGMAQTAFGMSGSFAANYTYGVALVLANIAIAMSAVSYLLCILNVPNDPILVQGLTIVIIWFSTFANFPGAKFTGQISAVFIWGIFLPLLILICLGPFRFDADLFMNGWNSDARSLPDVMKLAVPLMFWSFLGLESACVNAESVENPKTAMPKAILVATGAVAVIYFLSTTLISGLVPRDTLAGSDAPIFVVFHSILGDTASKVVACFIFMASASSLIGWQFTMARVFETSAELGYFPEVFGKKSRAGGEQGGGILILTFVQTLLVMLLPNASLFTLFDAIVNFSCITNIFSFFLCMAAAFVIMRNARTSPRRRILVGAMAGVSLLFMLWIFSLTDPVVLKWCSIALLIGLAYYAVRRSVCGDSASDSTI